MVCIRILDAKLVLERASFSKELVKAWGMSLEEVSLLDCPLSCISLHSASSVHEQRKKVSQSGIPIPTSIFVVSDVQSLVALCRLAKVLERESPLAMAGRLWKESAKAPNP